MSLNTAVTTATSSLLVLEQQMSVISNNIANANTENYTKKSVTVASQVSAGQGVGVMATAVTGLTDKYLVKSIVAATSDSAEADAYSDMYELLQAALGTVSSTTDSDSSGDDISSLISTLTDSLSELADDPDSSSLKNQVVSNLDDVATALRSLSSTVQDLRSQAEQSVSDTIDDINSQLYTIQDLNQQIAAASARGDSTSDLEDQRNAALESLSADIDIDYYVTSTNQVVISTGGQTLLDTTVHELSHDTASSLSSEISYSEGSATGIDGIYVNGVDITNSVSSGKLAAYIEMRDEVLPNVQDELDSLASSLADTVNAIANQGAASDAPQTLTGTETVASTDAVTVASGTTVRIAVTDSSGDIDSYVDVDLSGASTVQDVVDTINTALSGAGVDATASLDGSGHLVLSAGSSDEGVAVSTLSGSLGDDATNFSDYFGLNDILTGGDSAATIAVSSALLDSSDLLPVGTLSTSDSGDAVTSGDSSIASALYDALIGSTTFSASGYLGSTTDSFAGYASDIIADVATRYSRASTQATSKESTLSSLTDSYSSETGVNIDEETAQLTILQNAYSASAQVLSAAQSMFDALISAVS